MTIRKNLTPPESRAIEEKLPQLDFVVSAVLRLSPDLVSIKFSPNSSIPVASICFRDAVDLLCDVKFALFEAFAHKVWFENYEAESNRWVGIHFARFFADDSALRLYSAGEHLAAGLINMLEISKKQLAKCGKQKRINLKLARVAQHLWAERPDDEISKSLQRLITSKDWNATLEYRNKWVHNQPPLISGVGIVYERRNRWIVSDDAIAVTFGGGDKPHHSVEELLGSVQRSTLLFSKVVREVVSLYVELLSRYGIQVTEENMSVAM